MRPYDAVHFKIYFACTSWAARFKATKNISLAQETLSTWPVFKHTEVRADCVLTWTSKCMIYFTPCKIQRFNKIFAYLKFVKNLHESKKIDFFNMHNIDYNLK